MRQRDRLEVLTAVAVSLAAVAVVLVASWTVAAMILEMAR